MCHSKMPYKARLRFLEAEKELERHSQLDYTLIRIGVFMDYLGQPYMPTTLSNTLYCLVDLPALKINIPGNGMQPVVFTHTTDVGQSIAALLDLEAEAWPRESAIIGKRLTLNDLVKLYKKLWGR